jgi:probable HAF family extracellular repeat protein
MSVKLLALGALLVAPSTLVVGGVDAQDGYTVVELDQLDDTASGCASAINESGDITGQNYVGGSGRAVHWDPDGEVRDIGSLGGVDNRGLGINDAGDIVGYSEVLPSGDEHAFVYDAATSMLTDIHPPMADPGSDSEAEDINESGEVVGSMDVGGNGRAFLYDPAGPTWTDLGTLGGTHSEGNAISDDGFVAGYSNTPGGDRHPFRWNPDTATMADLGTNGGADALAFDMNNSHELVGWSERAGGLPTNGYLLNGGYTTLVPADDLVGSQAIGMNDTGDAVGESWDSSLPDWAFMPTLWPRGEDPVSLPRLGELDSSLYDINDAGVIVGCSAVSETETVAARWDPPVEPDTPTTDGDAGDAPLEPLTPAAAATALATEPSFTG